MDKYKLKEKIAIEGLTGLRVYFKSISFLKIKQIKLIN